MNLKLGVHIGGDSPWSGDVQWVTPFCKELVSETTKSRVSVAMVTIAHWLLTAKNDMLF